MSRRCCWGTYVPKSENARGVDIGKLERSGKAWECRHGTRVGSDFCLFHERVHGRYSMILDWAVYQLSRRRDSFAGHAYDWAVRKDVASLNAESLSKALELIIADRARDGAKRNIVEASDLVRSVAAIQRDNVREGGGTGEKCGKCHTSGWAGVWDRYDENRTAVACCTCVDGRKRSIEAVNRGQQIPTVGNLPARWTTRNPIYDRLDTTELV